MAILVFHPTKISWQKVCSSSLNDRIDSDISFSILNYEYNYINMLKLKKLIFTIVGYMFNLDDSYFESCSNGKYFGVCLYGNNQGFILTSFNKKQIFLWMK